MIAGVVLKLKTSKKKQAEYLTVKLNSTVNSLKSMHLFGHAPLFSFTHFRILKNTKKI